MKTNEELKSNPTLIIETIFNKEESNWEVTLNDSLMGTFQTEIDAANASEMIYSSFETGYVNGLLLAFESNGLKKAKEALESRGIQFETRLRLSQDD